MAARIVATVTGAAQTAQETISRVAAELGRRGGLKGGPRKETEAVSTEAKCYRQKGGQGPVEAARHSKCVITQKVDITHLIRR